MKQRLQALLITATFVLNSTFFVNAQTMSAGGSHSTFVCASGDARATGSNTSGQLGNGTTVSTLTPLVVNGLTGIIATSSKDQFTLFLKNDSTVWAVGYNGYGQFGNDTTLNSDTAIQIPNLTGVIKIAAGTYHSLFLKSNGTVWACGRNFSGELGDGTQTQRDTPVLVSSLTSIIDIAAGDYHSLFLRADSTVWACGDNQNGVLGLGSGSGLQVPNPTQITAISGVTKIAGGFRHSLFIKQDSTVWACGNNNAGQLGDSTNIEKDLPVKINTLSGIVAIAAGQQHSLFLKSNGTVWASGANLNGQLGDGTNVDKIKPVQVSGLTGITQVAASGLYHSLFLKNNNTFWGCGQNNVGQLGDGTGVGSNIPVQVLDGCVPNSIAEMSNDIRTLVYPNPSNGLFNIQVSGSVLQGSTIEICNLEGKIVYSEKTLSTNNTFNLSNQSKGLYFYKVKNNSGTISAGKVVIN